MFLKLPESPAVDCLLFGFTPTWHCKLIQRRTVWDVRNSSIYYMMFVSYQSSLSKEIIKLHYKYPDNSIKKRKRIDLSACLLGEATVSEWIWVRFYRIKWSPLQTLFAVWVNTFCWCDTVCSVTSYQWYSCFSFPNLVLLRQCKASP